MEKHCKISWYRDINERLNIQSLANNIMFGSLVMAEDKSFLEREKAGREELMKSIRGLGGNCEELLKIFEEYGEVIQEVYFEVGVNIGICLQTELLLKEQGI